jgi:dolichol-phosphate mannosyltransferase
MNYTIDIIVPVCDEEENIPIFIDSINRLIIPEHVSLRIFFIEDSSNDQTLHVLRRSVKQYENIAYYSLSKGYGAAAAVMFGMNKSIADALIMMDIDGAHPVELIPNMINYFLKGADIVQAIRINLSNRKLYRVIGAFSFNIIFRILTGFNAKKQNVYFRLISKKYKNVIIQNKKFIHTLRIKFPQNDIYQLEEIYFSAKERILGESKYNLLLLLKTSLDFIFSIISKTRFIIFCLFLVLLGIISTLVGYLYLSSIFAIIIILISLKYFRMSHNNILINMELKEQQEIC